MATTATLRCCICHFNADGSVHVEATVALADDVLGPLDLRVVALEDPTLRAGVRQAALALAPATEIALGVPLIVPVPTGQHT